MSVVKYNKTATFLFPLLEIPRELFACSIKNNVGKIIIQNRFINAYLYDKKIERYKENHLFVVVNNYQDIEFNTFFSTMTAFANYIDDYEQQDQLVLIYSISEELLPDYKLLINGEYSKISAKAKKLVLSNHFFDGKAFTLPLILNKAEALKDSWEERLSNPGSVANLYDQEVWPIMDLPKEILNYSTAIKLVKAKNIIVPSEDFKQF
jgi:hypothetical protein